MSELIPEWILKREWTHEERLRAVYEKGIHMRMAFMTKFQCPFYGKEFQQQWLAGWEEEDVRVHIRKARLASPAHA